MKTNILQAIIEIIDNNLFSIKKYKDLNYKININNMGEALENFIKDSLCSGFHLEKSEKIVIQNEYFSYLGNQNNPPDLIIRQGDAFEIKKIESNEGFIALNSSFPKDKLYKNNNMLTNDCKNCEENWLEKDICYIIGHIDKNEQIKSLWFVYGNCYAANPKTYSRIKDAITENIKDLPIEFFTTNEIAKAKKVDPLGITDLRVRGMWSIKHPAKVFEYITTKNTKPHIKALMLKEKFYSFESNLIKKISSKCNIKNVKIQNPNNPANLLDAVLLEYEFNA